LVKERERQEQKKQRLSKRKDAERPATKMLSEAPPVPSSTVDSSPSASPDHPVSSPLPLMDRMLSASSSYDASLPPSFPMLPLPDASSAAYSNFLLQTQPSPPPPDNFSMPGSANFSLPNFSFPESTSQGSFSLLSQVCV